MNKLIKTGKIFLIIGGLSFFGLVFLLMGFAVGAAPVPPLTGLSAALAMIIYYNGSIFHVYLIIGAVLIVAGLIRERAHAKNLPRVSEPLTETPYSELADANEEKLLRKYETSYPHNPRGVLEFHISRRVREGKTREQAVGELLNERA